MDWYQIVLRILHIAAGVFWAGSAFFFFFFFEPATKKLGPQAGPFLEEVMQRRKAPIVITVAAAVNVLAGVLLYWRVSGGLDPDWITTATGLGLTVGGLCAIAAFALGLAVIKPSVDKLGALAAEVGAAGGTPTPEQGARLHAIEARLTTVGRVDIVLLTVAVLAMAIARYL